MSLQLLFIMFSECKPTLAMPHIAPIVEILSDPELFDLRVEGNQVILGLSSVLPISINSSVAIFLEK